MSDTVYIGLLGLGTVGSGLVKALASHRDHIERQLGRSIAVRRCLVRDPEKPRRVRVDRELLTTDYVDILDDPAISVVVEVVGGVDPARRFVAQALLAGKHVVTANKELLAKHGDELRSLAQAARVRLLFEASAGGGIPIVHTLQSYLAANRVTALRGILNGTCNYILTQMQSGLSFPAALARAQELGYAEADPESDIAGHDTAYKLAILSSLAFGMDVQAADVPRTGITALESVDLALAEDLGAVVKLIGEASLADGHLTLSVGPRLLPAGDPLAGVGGVLNAVTVSADIVGDLTLIGPGAGEMPTASAVLEDLMELLSASAAAEREGAHWGARHVASGQGQRKTRREVGLAPRVQTVGDCYVRVKFNDVRERESVLERLHRFVRQSGASMQRLDAVRHDVSVAAAILRAVPVDEVRATLGEAGADRLFVAPCDLALGRNAVEQTSVMG